MAQASPPVPVAEVRAHGHEDPGGMSMPYLGTVLFLASEILFFAGLFGAYFTLRSNAPAWPPQGIPHIEATLPLVLTAILVTSSFTVHGALWAVRNDNRPAFVSSLGVTLLLAVAFLFGEIYDAAHLGFGIKAGVYGTAFFTLVGFHALHVTGGVILLSVIFYGALTGRFSSTNHQIVESANVYWHFVDVVWICLVVTLYVIK